MAAKPVAAMALAALLVCGVLGVVESSDCPSVVPMEGLDLEEYGRATWYVRLYFLPSTLYTIPCVPPVDFFGER